MGFLPGPLATLGAAVPDLALGVVFLIAWVAPQTFGTNIIPSLMLTMLLEFIIMHSSAFLGNAAIAGGSVKRAAPPILGITAFYTLFVAGFAFAFKTWWPLVTFWAQTINRLLGLMLGQAPSGEEKIFLQRTWAVSGLFYLGFGGVTTLLPIPALGVIGEFREGLPSSGLWVSEPQRVIAFGFLYFTAVGLSELHGHRWLPASGLPKDAPADGGARAGR